MAPGYTENIMRTNDLYPSIVTTYALAEIAHYVVLIGFDGTPCPVWLNPANSEFAGAIDQACPGALSGLRGLVTATDIYVWQSVNLTHGDVERLTGIHGVRLALRSREIQVNDETVALPEHFPWMFPDPVRVEIMDIEDRRAAVARGLQTNSRLQAIYPSVFKIGWYS
jgi:hypothetical protein